MDWNYVGLIAIAVTFLFILVQRTDPKRRRLSIFFVLLCLLMIRHNAFLKGALDDETLLACHFAICLGCAVWLLIGRYNRVEANDEIRVMGMDD
ncbi:MAG: hypothetical protein F4X87_02945 [Chloroflexi bacterium]|nr:hypothetical protein [Chloroflexota bacterium]